jgi:hypothetical protein
MQQASSTTPNFATQPNEFLAALYQAAVKRALPLHNTAAYLPTPPKGRTVVLGAGKAGGAMAQTVEALWPADKPLSGLVVTRSATHHPAQWVCPSALKWSRRRTLCPMQRASLLPSASWR